MPKIPETVPWTATGRTLGEGGQAQVVEVKPSAVAKVPAGAYAMKVLRSGCSRQAFERFKREVAAIQTVEDPRVVKVVDFNTDGAFRYYVMPDYVAQGYRALSKIMFELDSPFRHDPVRCLELIADCAEAVSSCHSKDVVHRDIKPDNILVDERFRPVILDFGCCQLDQDSALTLADEGVGTRNYMAPECESGSEGQVTEKADIYSLGKLLWSLVTALQPFAREQPAFTNMNLRRLIPDSPDCWHLTRVFLRSIRGDPGDRSGDANAMAEYCRWLARSVVGRYPPVELVKKCCPACGQGDLVRSLPGQQLPMHMVFGNPMPSGVSGYVCAVCGLLYAWDNRVLKDYLAKLEQTR